MSYMGSIAMRGKSIVGSPTETTMPSDVVFRQFDEPEHYTGMVRVGEEALKVSDVYSNGPEVMDRRK